MSMFSRKAFAALFVSLLLGSSQVLAQADLDLEDEDQRVSYSVGVSIGQKLMQQQVIEGLDTGAFFTGMRDVVDGAAQLSEDEIIATLQAFQQRMMEEAQSTLNDNLAASEAFLAENATQDGVVALDSGLQYLVLESGPASGASPAASDSVLAHYHGTLTDGTVFDSSVERGEPAQFGLNQVISGWTEALQLMKVGDKWRLFIPPDMAYGTSSPTPAIPPNSTLIFDVELLEIR